MKIAVFGVILSRTDLFYGSVSQKKFPVGQSFLRVFQSVSHFTPPGNFRGGPPPIPPPLPSPDSTLIGRQKHFVNRQIFETLDVENIVHLFGAVFHDRL